MYVYAHRGPVLRGKLMYRKDETKVERRPENYFIVKKGGNNWDNNNGRVEK
jgi:hypothetical protein